MSQETSGVKRAQQSEVRPHQLGQDVFKTILPDDVDWKPYPAFPSSVRLAVVVGQPSEPGPYTIRVKSPHGAKPCASIPVPFRKGQNILRPRWHHSHRPQAD